MCEFCTKHGEGKKWYFNVKNYSSDLLSDVRRNAFVKRHFFWLDENYSRYFRILKFLNSIPFVHHPLKAIVKNAYLYKHWGQVIPIEDIEHILDFTNSIVRVPCGCRMATTKREHRTCFLVSMDVGKAGLADIVDQSYFGGPDVAKFEKVSKESALRFMRESESKGMMHTVWAFSAPFVGGFCNCDSATGCIPMKMHKEAVPMVFRAEYCAVVNDEQCTGCRKCVKICPFDAIHMNKQTDRATIDQKKCHGCGICRSACSGGSIKLADRRSIAVASGLWH